MRTLQVDIILVEVSSVGQQEGEEPMQEQESDAEEGVHGAHYAASSSVLLPEDGCIPWQR